MFGRWAHYGMPLMLSSTILRLQSPLIRAQPQVASTESRYFIDFNSLRIALHVHICVQQHLQPSQPRYSYMSLRLMQCRMKRRKAHE